MKDFFDQFKKTKIKQLMIRLKHLRGKHDQLDHAWNRGMGRGGGGADLAPNQMGPLPTADFYRQRRIELMSQQREGLITNAQMRSEMRQLRGITVDALESNNVSENTILANKNIRQKIREFQEQRNKERLVEGFDISAIRDQLVPVGIGIGNVKKIVINGQNYYYRDTPYHTNKVGALWSTLRGPFKGLAADNIASAMGLPVAPAASLTNESFVITPEMKLEPFAFFPYLEQLKKAYFDANTPEDKSKAQERYIRLMEPLAIMDLIIGQNDGHSGNINIVANPNRELYDAEYITTSVDYDLSGRNYHKSIAIVEWARGLALDGNGKDKRILTPEMREILTQFSQTIQWHFEVPERAREEYLNRVQVILDMDATMTVGDLSPNSVSQTGKLDPSTDIDGNEISRSIKKVLESQAQTNLELNKFIDSQRNDLEIIEYDMLFDPYTVNMLNSGQLSPDDRNIYFKVLALRDLFLENIRNLSKIGLSSKKYDDIKSKIISLLDEMHILKEQFNP